MMVSISRSLRFHDMMRVGQGRNGLWCCVFAKVRWSVVVFPVELLEAPTMTLMDGDAAAEVTTRETSLGTGCLGRASKEVAHEGVGCHV